MPGRTYVDVVTIGTTSVYQVDSNPDGVLSAAQGSLAIRSDTAALYQNTDGATAWSAVGSGGGGAVSLAQKRVQLVDLTGNSVDIDFDSTIPAGSLILGWSIWVDAITQDEGTDFVTYVPQVPGSLAGYRPLTETLFLQNVDESQWSTPAQNVDASPFYGSAVLTNAAGTLRFNFAANAGNNFDTFVTVFDVYACVWYAASGFTFPA